jgi:SAM-dependent methyltransferase
VGRDDALRQMLAANEANWNERTKVHVNSSFYGLDGSRSPFSWFAPEEWDDLGELSGRDVLHLMCHLGTETIAFALKGARVVGLDFSAASIQQARRIARQAGVDVEYVRSDVYDAASALGRRQFDVIYTGKGALCYLPDLGQWASIIADVLRPAGLLYIVEFHPLLNALGPKPQPGAGPELVLRYDYLAGAGAIKRDATFTYTDGPALSTARVAYEWAHGLGSVITALVGAGLWIVGMRESEVLPWPRWERMIQTDHGWWRLPDHEPRIPLMYTLSAIKPS